MADFTYEKQNIESLKSIFTRRVNEKIENRKTRIALKKGFDNQVNKDNVMDYIKYPIDSFILKMECMLKK